MTNRFLILCTLSLCVLTSGCATLLRDAVPNALKTSEQIRTEKAEVALETASEKQRQAVAQLAGAAIPLPGARTQPAVEQRRLYIKERETYVNQLKAQCDARIAKIEQRAMNAGAFILGTKAYGIMAGIASAVLVVASPANAPAVAGLVAFSTGLTTFEGKASELGYSMVVAEGQAAALKDKSFKAYTAFKDISFEYLHAYAEFATDQQWATEMKTLGGKIIEYEAAVRYTKFDIKIEVKNEDKNGP